jgi:NAD(P)-dependent dehydrogenase (short-subunit alcohol dehydrogenase family)
LGCLQDYSTVLTTNLESAFKLCQLCRPLLKAAGSSSILFNSSVAGGPLAMFSGTLYAMSKAALNQLTKNLAVEWAPDGIRVNSVAPWYTATPLAMQVGIASVMCYLCCLAREQQMLQGTSAHCNSLGSALRSGFDPSTGSVACGTGAR